MSVRRWTEVLIATAALAGATAIAQAKTEPGADVQMVLTVADHVNNQPAPLDKNDLTIADGTVTDVIPLESRDLDLFILIDDAANYDFGPKLQELRSFVAAQPSPVSIGVAYIHDGALQIVENPTTDHPRAAAALREPSGGRTGEPYCAVADLIQQWEKKSLRREIILVSSGIDDSASEDGVCVSADMAIRDAERAGVIVYALYNPASGYLSQKRSTIDAGVNDLAHVCYETGGEAYFTGHSPARTLDPFLSDISEHLANQYLVKFHLIPTTPDGFQTIHAVSGTFGQELMTPDKVWLGSGNEH